MDLHLPLRLPPLLLHHQVYDPLSISHQILLLINYYNYVTQIRGKFDDFGTIIGALTHYLYSIVDQLDPEIGAAVKSGNIVNIRTSLMSRYLKAFKTDYQHQQEIAAIEADPMNAGTHSLTHLLTRIKLFICIIIPDNQRKIEEAIKNENINNNRNLAMENIPESFIAVCMLYVRITINDTPIMAFVDSGAQSTIMSIKCAEKCIHFLLPLIKFFTYIKLLF